MAITRRDFIKANAVAALGLAAAGGGKGTTLASAPKKTARIGVVGTGNRGRSLMNILLRMEDVEIPALCDIQKPHLDLAMDMVVKSGRPQPEAYLKDEYTFKKLMDRDDLDAVIIASYWEWHAPMAVYAMKAGKYAATEVPAAYTLEECWDLVNTHEETQVPCMMLENWSFRRDNLAVLNMIRQGLLGDIVHCHCAHSHDCIDHWFFDPETGMDRWAAKYLLHYNRDQYPTHQLGPVISWMDIGCGDYFDRSPLPLPEASASTITLSAVSGPTTRMPSAPMPRATSSAALFEQKMANPSLSTTTCSCLAPMTTVG